jgi:hypothetical protein
MTVRRGITSALALISVAIGCRSVIGLDDLERVDCIDCDDAAFDTELDAPPIDDSTSVSTDTVAETLTEDTSSAADTFADDTTVADTIASDAAGDAETAPPVDSPVLPDTAPDTAAPDTAIDAGPTTVVAPRSTWRYVDTGMEPAGWTAFAYADGEWKAGPAPLGYGDTDLATKIFSGSADAGTRVITAYFRRSFTVTNPSMFSSLTVNLQRDDGAIVYFNGTEVIRSNMPSGAPTSSTFAVASMNSPEESLYNPFLLPASLLRTGTNVIAVEVHQVSVTSSDIRFDLELIAR